MDFPPARHVEHELQSAGFADQEAAVALEVGEVAGGEAALGQEGLQDQGHRLLHKATVRIEGDGRAEAHMFRAQADALEIRQGMVFSGVAAALPIGQTARRVPPHFLPPPPDVAPLRAVHRIARRDDEKVPLGVSELADGGAGGQRRHLDLARDEVEPTHQVRVREVHDFLPAVEGEVLVVRKAERQFRDGQLVLCEVEEFRDAFGDALAVGRGPPVDPGGDGGGGVEVGLA